MELTETSYSIDANTSNVHYKVYAQSSGSGSINATHNKQFVLNGSTIIDWTGNVNVRSPNAYIGIAEGDMNNIGHNSDGSMSISFYAQIAASSYGISAGLSGTFYLTTIPRASTVTCTSGNIGESVTITVNKASSNFTHTLTYSFGSLSGTIATKTANASVGFTIPTTFYAQIPNAKSGVCTITCQTFNGNTSMGSKTCTFTATASEAACQPTLSVSIADVNSTTTALTGDSSKLVMNLSTARVSITTTAKNSATIATKVVNDISVSGTSVDIANVTASSFTITVTDSRGYSNSLTMTPTVVNYIPLTINATVARNNPTDNKVNLTYTGNYFNASFGTTTNTLTLKWYYREKGASSWTTGGTLSPTKSGNTYSNGSTATSLGSVFNYQKQYEIKLEAKDKATTLEPIYQISQGLPVFNWGADFFNVNGNVTATGTMAATGNMSTSGDLTYSGTLYKGTENILQRHAITIGKTNNQSVGTSGFTTVQMNSSWNVVGSKLSFDSTNYSIKVGAVGSGTHHLLVSGLLWVSVAGGYKWGQIIRKRTSPSTTWVVFSSVISPKSVYENWDNVPFPAVIMDVQEGDLIYAQIAVTGNTGTVEAGTYGRQSTYLTAVLLD